MNSSSHIVAEKFEFRWGFSSLPSDILAAASPPGAAAFFVCEW